MVYRFRTIISAGAVSLLAAFPALAGVTTGDIRTALVDLYTRAGATVDIGAESVSGDTMTLENVSMTFHLGKDKGQVSLSYGWIDLTQIGDQVKVTLAPKMQIRGNLAGRGGKEVLIKAHLADEGMAILASGAMDDLTLKTTAPTVNLVLDEITSNGKKIPAIVGYTGVMVNSTYQITKLANNRRRYSGNSSMATLALKLDVKQPGGKGYVAVNAKINDLKSVFAAEMDQLNPADFGDPQAFFKMGFDGGGRVSSGAYTIVSRFKTGRDAGSSNVSADGAQLGFNLSPKAVGYNIGLNGVKIEATFSALPVPAVKLGFDALALSFAVPMSKQAEPADFHVKTALRGLTADESLWAMVDPAKVLPRDPITIAVDLSGKVMVLADLMNPKTLKTIKGPPFLPVSVSLNELTAAAVGAILTGSGSAKFDLSSGKTVNGVPLPVGSITLDLKGAYGLMDSLTGMGLLPDKTATGLKAMLGAFSKPVGEDHVTSTIEATADGAITANGQRIQ